jgi:hypothetical protein
VGCAAPVAVREASGQLVAGPGVSLLVVLGAVAVALVVGLALCLLALVLWGDPYDWRD